MPRKAAAPVSTDAQAEPRRSSRIKDQPKGEAPPKKASKPRTKKAKPVEEKVVEDEEPAAEEPTETTKPKSAKGRKRTAADKEAEEPAADPPTPTPAPAAQTEDAPPSKKVCGLSCTKQGKVLIRTRGMSGQTRFQTCLKGCCPA